MKENLNFKQWRLIIKTAENQNNKKEHIRLVMVSIRVDVVAKTNCEIYQNLWLLFLCFLCYAKEGRVAEILKVM